MNQNFEKAAFLIALLKHPRVDEKTIISLRKTRPNFIQTNKKPDVY